MPIKEDVSELREKIRECEKALKSFPCSCALASIRAIDNLRLAQTSMWQSGTANLAETERSIIEVSNQCPGDFNPVRKTFDKIRELLREGNREDAANKISDTIISLYDTLFLCASE